MYKIFFSGGTTNYHVTISEIFRWRIKKRVFSSGWCFGESSVFLVTCDFRWTCTTTFCVLGGKLQNTQFVQRLPSYVCWWSDVHADVPHCQISAGQTTVKMETCVTQRSRNLKNKKMSWGLLRSAASTCRLYKSWTSCSGAVKVTTSMSSRMEAHELVSATPELLAMALELLDSPSWWFCGRNVRRSTWL